jgi:PHD/YefM family antitoxin component YafN of YafNO toxin-antitoxin module
VVRTMSISDARRQLTSLDLDREETVAVTNRGKRVYALMAWDVYESLSETLDILSDPALVEQLQKSMREADQGELVSHEEVMRELG